MRPRYDAVVVGGGVSGLAAATWLARFRRAVLVVDSGEYRAAAVERTHGYLGEDPLRPMEFLDAARRDLLAYPTATWRSGRVVGGRGGSGRFELLLHDGSVLTTARVVLATGVADAFPDVEGFAEHYGASVFHCPACDGYDAEDRDVVALGWDERLVGFAATLLNWARSVTVVTDGRRFEGDDACRDVLDRHGVPLVEETVVALVGRRHAMSGVRLASGRLLPASLLFFSVAHQPRAELAVELGCALDGDGYVAVDAEGLSTVPGVYAAGDLVPGLQLVQVAAAKGTVAGCAAALSLHGEPGSPASPSPAPDAAAELAAADR